MKQPYYPRVVIHIYNGIEFRKYEKSFKVAEPLAEMAVMQLKKKYKKRIEAGEPVIIEYAKVTYEMKKYEQYTLNQIEAENPELLEPINQ